MAFGLNLYFPPKQGDKTNLKRVIRIYDLLKCGKAKDARLS